MVEPIYSDEVEARLLDQVPYPTEDFAAADGMFLESGPLGIMLDMIAGLPDSERARDFIRFGDRAMLPAEVQNLIYRRERAR